MKSYARSAFIVVSASLFAGCAGSQLPAGPPGAMQNVSGRVRPNRCDRSCKYKVVYTFAGAPDGDSPQAGLIDVGGTLYGTTAYGGSKTPCNAHAGLCGTVFSITLPSGTEKVLHSFGYGADGADPVASLIEVKGRLYGTTMRGGAYNEGTVFSITTSDTEKVLHSFHATDGAYPVGSLISVKGNFYGTTMGGGANGQGTVFTIERDGTESVLHSFGSGRDGFRPESALIEVGGSLYG